MTDQGVTIHDGDMEKVTITKNAIEMMKPDGSGKVGAKMALDAFEVMASDGTVRAKMTEDKIEVMKTDGTPGTKMDKDTVEVLRDDGTIGATMTMDTVEVMKTDGTVGAKMGNATIAVMSDDGKEAVVSLTNDTFLMKDAAGMKRAIMQARTRRDCR